MSLKQSPFCKTDMTTGEERTQLLKRPASVRSVKLTNPLIYGKIKQ